VVIGGGYVGVELAQAFSRFGSEVTIVESGTQLLGREDPEVADAVSSIFAEDGIDVIVGARTESVSGRSGKRVSIRVTCARAIGETRGFMKILLDDTDDRILGFTMLGAEGGEVLAVVQTAMLGNMPYTTLRDAAILTHPTMAEGLNVLLSTVPK
jgi:pyruvate/2-oxoglutarate dehydrogenase complex dihydrolipoamide dehydrogenase (E3) component